MKRTFIFTAVLLLPVLALVNAPASAATSVTFTQLTNTSGGFIFGPSLSANSQLIAFNSDMELVPGQNVAGDIQIFLMNTNGTGLVQLTHVAGGLGGRSLSTLSADGTKVAFHSNRDLVAGQNTDGNDEIFLISIDGTGLVQLTHTTVGQSYPSSLSASGSQVAFSSTADFVGNNPDGNFEIFLAMLGP